MRTALGGLIVAAFVTVTTVAMADPVVEIEDAYVRATPPGTDVTAGYMRLRNTGETGVRLVAAQTDVAEYVELHDHIHEDGVMKMRQVEAIELPAGAEVALEPGGLHLMMFRLGEPLAAGRVVNLRLEFSDGERRDIQAEVRHPSSDHGHGHDHEAH